VHRGAGHIEVLRGLRDIAIRAHERAVQDGAFSHNDVVSFRVRLANQIGRWNLARERSSIKAERPARRARCANNQVIAIDCQ